MFIEPVMHPWPERMRILAGLFKKRRVANEIQQCSDIYIVPNGVRAVAITLDPYDDPKKTMEQYSLETYSDLTPRPTNTTKALAATITKPSNKLQAKTWLHDRPEADVFKLLIDTYRLRMEDMYNFGVDAEADSVYNLSPDGSKGFMRFLKLAESRPGLLPTWWSKKKAIECLNFGATGSWASLASAVEKSDLIHHYDDAMMPMQLRMFGEQVYGTGPAGMSGAEMLRLQVNSENGGFYSTTIDTANKMFKN
ncbi:hypothetical protein BGZ49_010592 [Haplosporangium sp. Z 27]|nr:hypothetical protein BGZ49_010592 [Haplosporangium sp. Z 27]